VTSRPVSTTVLRAADDLSGRHDEAGTTRMAFRRGPRIIRDERNSQRITVRPGPES